MAPTRGRNLSEDHRFVQVVDQLASGYKTIGQMVYAVLREAIANGAFAPGEWLRQDSLAEAIGVSRIPVRTALLQLEAEGLVTFHPHRGARVRTLSRAQIEEIYSLRVVLESHALRLSMARMTDSRLAILQELAEQLDNEHEGSGLIESRVSFYREAYDAANNPLLVEMIEELRGHVGRFLLSFRVEGPGHSHRKHTDLVAHIQAGDLIGAEAWLRAHLEEVQSGIMSLAAEAEDGENAETAEDGAIKSSSKSRGNGSVSAALRAANESGAGPNSADVLAKVVASRGKGSRKADAPDAKGATKTES